MYKYQRTIRLSETDATGVLFFAELLKMAVETFEAFLIAQGYPLQQMILQSDFLMPIVHAEANFLAPLYVGDELAIHLNLRQQGTSSFTLNCSFFSGEKEVGNTMIVHVVVAKETGKSIPLPPEIKRILKIEER